MADDTLGHQDGLERLVFSAIQTPAWCSRVVRTTPCPVPCVAPALLYGRMSLGQWEDTFVFFTCKAAHQLSCNPIAGATVPSDKGGYRAGLRVSAYKKTFVAEFIFDDPADREKAVNGGGPRIMAWMVRLSQLCIILHPLHSCSSCHTCLLGTVCRLQVAGSACAGVCHVGVAWPPDCCCLQH